jgi:tRNA (guanine10-N2)-methyltransferase
MQNDILAFASRTLVTDGRICMWMPTSSDEDGELRIPMNPNLDVVSVSVQPFNNCQYHFNTRYTSVSY